MKNFTIINSTEDLSYSPAFGGPDMITTHEAEVVSIEVLDNENYRINVKHKGITVSGYLRSKNKIGTQKLNIILQNQDKIIGKTYSEMVHKSFYFINNSSF